jgi:hypothetical protein
MAATEHRLHFAKTVQVGHSAVSQFLRSEALLPQLPVTLLALLLPPRVSSSVSIREATSKSGNSSIVALRTPKVEFSASL